MTNLTLESDRQLLKGLMSEVANQHGWTLSDVLGKPVINYMRISGGFFVNGAYGWDDLDLCVTLTSVFEEPRWPAIPVDIQGNLLYDSIPSNIWNDQIRVILEEWVVGVADPFAWAWLHAVNETANGDWTENFFEGDEAELLEANRAADVRNALRWAAVLRQPVERRLVAHNIRDTARSLDGGELGHVIDDVLTTTKS
jgi:hypothetical protein